MPADLTLFLTLAVPLCTAYYALLLAIWWATSPPARRGKRTRRRF